MIRRLLAAVILFSMATGLHAETYQEWEKAFPNSRPIPFKAWQSPQTDGRKFNDVAYSVFEAPLGHLFGHLDFSSYPPADFPLRVRVLYERIRESDMSREGNGFNPRVPDWTSPLKFVAPNARLGDLIESREVQIPSARESSMPVWSIWTQGSRSDYENLLNPYAVLVEVTGHDGALLARQRLIEAVAGVENRNVNLARTTSAPMSQKTLGDWTLTESLPTEAAVYEDIKFLWLDPATLHDPAYPDSFWHQVFFAGTKVVGADPDVQELAQRLGLEPNQRVLQGGLWTVSHLSDEFLESIRSNQNGNSYFNATDAPNPFKNHVILGKKRTHELRVFSIWFLVSFTIFELVIIIGSIYLLHGGRRVFRWLLIPISAILYTIAGLFIVRLVVDFRPEVQVFREIDSVEGWPESSVSTQVTRLAFNNDRTSFSTPAPSAFRWSAIESETAPLVSTPNADRMTFSMRQHYGRFSTLQIGYAQPTEIPCTVSADGQFTATRPLRGGWLWDGKVWRELGPMEPGQSITIAKAKVAVDPGALADMGAHPARYQSEGSLPEAARAMVDPGYLTSLKDTRVGLLLAIDDRALPEQVDDAAGSEIHTQTLLVHQFQLPAPVVTTPP